MDVTGNIGEVDEIWFMGEMADISVTGYGLYGFTLVHWGSLEFAWVLFGLTWVHLGSLVIYFGEYYGLFGTK